MLDSVVVSTVELSMGVEIGYIGAHGVVRMGRDLLVADECRGVPLRLKFCAEPYTLPEFVELSKAAPFMEQRSYPLPVSLSPAAVLSAPVATQPMPSPSVSPCLSFVHLSWRSPLAIAGLSK